MKPKTETKLLFFIFLFLISVSFAYATDIYTNDFPTNSTYAADGWAYTTTCAAATNKNYPQASPYGTFAFSHYQNNSCGAGLSKSIARTIPNSTSGVLQFAYKVAIYNNTDASNNPARIFFYDVVSGVNYIELSITPNSSFIACSGFNCARCNMTLSYEKPLISPVNLFIDLENNYYTASINSNTYGCENIYFNGSKAKETGISAIKLQINNAVVGDNFTVYMDDIIITNDALIVEALGIGDACLSGADCLTGKCEGGYCVQKLGKEGCSASVECVSGSCVNGLCSKPSSAQLMRAAKNENFGDDSDTANFISLFIATALLITVSVVGHSLIAVIIGFIAFFAACLFFTIIGWLSVWIMFGVFFVTLIGGVVLLVLKSGG